MALTRVKASVLSLIPDVIFVTLFEFYRWETEPADPPDEPKYSAWAFCAVALTSMTICLEFWLNFQFGIRLVTFSGIELPDGLLIGWSLPLWLVACFLMYLKDNRGFVLVLKNREKSRGIRVWTRLSGALLLSLFVFGAVSQIWRNPLPRSPHSSVPPTLHSDGLSYGALLGRVPF